MLDDVLPHGGDVVVAPLQFAGAAADVVDSDEESLVLSSSSLNNNHNEAERTEEQI